MRGTALALALLLFAAPAAAQELEGKKLEQRQAVLVVHKGWVALSVGWRDVVDAKIRAKLTSGLPTVIATRAYLFPQGGNDPVALSATTCRVVYDLWDEVFRIEIRQGGTRKKTVAVNVEGVLRRCGEARRMPIAASAGLDAKRRYFVGVIVEVNPLSKEMLDRIKRWVSLPKGAGTVGPGDSLFGSFVGLFVTQVPDADRAVAFRTQAFAPGSLAVIKEEEAKK